MLILAPTAADADLSHRILTDAGLPAEILSDMGQVAHAVAEGAGAILTTEEAVASDRAALVLSSSLREQPSWSDIPVLVLFRSGADSPEAVRAMNLFGNVTILERPVRMSTMLSSIRAALRGRRRQYELRDQLEEIARARDALKEADRRKDEFLATLAHELRNPLAPIRHAVQLMRLQNAPNPSMEWPQDVIDRQVSHLTRLVDDLLDLSRVTRGMVELRPAPCLLADVVNNALETTRPFISAEGHEVSVSLPEEPVVLNVDETRIAQVLANLLHNAAKYTPRGGKIRLEAEFKNGDVEFRVQDTGIGIPEEMLDRIFDMFTQVDRYLERTTGGLGIGLTLVRKLVALHGGTIEARSKGPGEGSEFVVRLPRTRVSTKTKVQDQPGLRDIAPMTRRIVVADDNLDAAESLAKLLRLYGHEVWTAHDGAEAVRMVDSYQPEIVLLDIGMPKLNGYEVAREIRKHPGGRRRILVAVTGWGQEEDRRRSMEAGIDHHIVKPVEEDALVEVLFSSRSERPR